MILLHDDDEFSLWFDWNLAASYLRVPEEESRSLSSLLQSDLITTTRPTIIIMMNDNDADDDECVKQLNGMFTRGFI